MHYITYQTFKGNTSPRTIQKDRERVAEMEGADYGAEPPILHDTVYSSVEEAELAINSYGDWYNNHGVKYKDGRAIKWLVRLEFHC